MFDIDIEELYSNLIGIFGSEPVEIDSFMDEVKVKTDSPTMVVTLLYELGMVDFCKHYCVHNHDRYVKIYMVNE